MAVQETAPIAQPSEGRGPDEASAGAVLYTRAGCQFCAAAGTLLLKRRIAFEEVDVTGDAAALERLAQRSGLDTLPQLFVDGHPLGGFEEIRRLDLSGELRAQIGRTDRRR